MWALRRHGRKVALGAGATWAAEKSLTLHAAEPAVPVFSLEATLYDEDKFTGRFQKIMNMIDPRTLLTTEAEIQDAKTKLKDFKEGTKTATDSQLWAAQGIIDACVHPVTGETMFAPGRMSAFVPMNVPICVGMLSAKSVKGSMFFQWLNQSYNVVNNYVNRSSESVEWSAIGQAYGLACGVSMGMALTFGAIRQKVTALDRLGPVIPYTCVVLASSANIAFTRMDEITSGVPVVDADGDKIGTSKEAGMIAIKETILTRTVCLPILPILLPGMIVQAASGVITGTAGKIILETILVGMAFSVGLPVALALKKQQMEIDVKLLEPELQGRKTKAGEPILFAYANKGL